MNQREHKKKIAEGQIIAAKVAVGLQNDNRLVFVQRAMRSILGCDPNDQAVLIDRLFAIHEMGEVAGDGTVACVGVQRVGPTNGDS